MREFYLFKNEIELMRWADHHKVSFTLAQAIRTYIYNATGGEPDEEAALQIVNDPDDEERNNVESIALNYADIKKEPKIKWKNKVYLNADEVEIVSPSALN